MVHFANGRYGHRPFLGNRKLFDYVSLLHFAPRESPLDYAVKNAEPTRRNEPGDDV